MKRGASIRLFQTGGAIFGCYLLQYRDVTESIFFVFVNANARFANVRNTNFMNEIFRYANVLLKTNVTDHLVLRSNGSANVA